MATASGKPRSATRGVGLVEVIVSMVVLTVALLALARLQFGSHQASTVSLQRTLAQVQALDMSERMWLDLRSPMAGVAAWQAAHQGTLPGWQGTVAAVPGQENLFRVRIEWTTPSGGAGSTALEHMVRIPRVAP